VFAQTTLFDERRQFIERFTGFGLNVFDLGVYRFVQATHDNFSCSLTRLRGTSSANNRTHFLFWQTFVFSIHRYTKTLSLNGIGPTPDKPGESAHL
jgi:hypothetical protein